jgi:hypothetical protein
VFQAQEASRIKKGGLLVFQNPHFPLFFSKSNFLFYGQRFKAIGDVERSTTASNEARRVNGLFFCRLGKAERAQRICRVAFEKK